MKPIGQELFRRAVNPRVAKEVALQLGPLAPWWMARDALEMAAPNLPEPERWLVRPALPNQEGACWILLGVDKRVAEYGLLRPAVLLPLVWLKSDSHDPGLPPKVRHAAEDVLAGLSLGDSPWKLWLNHNRPIVVGASQVAECLDLSDLEGALLQADSGWISLAGGLLVAVGGGSPNPRVWATGGWREGEGVTTVGHLAPKLALAMDYEVEEFFVPEEQVEEARGLLPGEGAGPVIRPLLQNEKHNPQLACGRYLALLDLEPQPRSDIEDHVTYYGRLLKRDEQAAVEFYERRLLELVVKRCRGRLGRLEPWPTHLVTIASRNSELIRLAVEVFRPQKCLILHTPDHKSLTVQPAEWCGKAGCEPACREFEYDHTVPHFRERLAERFVDLREAFAAGVPPERIAYDVTPGFGLMRLAIAMGVAERGSLLLLLHHRWWDDDFELKRRRRPNTEEYIVWRSGDPWSTRSGSRTE